MRLRSILSAVAVAAGVVTPPTVLVTAGPSAAATCTADWIDCTPPTSTTYTSDPSGQPCANSAFTANNAYFYRPGVSTPVALIETRYSSPCSTQWSRLSSRTDGTYTHYYAWVNRAGSSVIGSADTYGASSGGVVYSKQIRNVANSSATSWGGYNPSCSLYSNPNGCALTGYGNAPTY